MKTPITDFSNNDSYFVLLNLKKQTEQLHSISVAAEIFYDSLQYDMATWPLHLGK